MMDWRKKAEEVVGCAEVDDESTKMVLYRPLCHRNLRVNVRVKIQNVDG